MNRLLLCLRMIQNYLLIASGMWPKVAQAQVNGAAQKEGDYNHFHLNPIGNGQGPQVTICNKRHIRLDNS